MNNRLELNCSDKNYDLENSTKSDSESNLIY